MKRINLKSLHLRNFKGVAELDIGFSDGVTEISGRNATGKTSVYDAFLWLIFGTNSQGDSDKGTNSFSRPKDKNGKTVDNVEIEVTGVLEVDGTSYEVQKIQKQKWTRPRGTDTKILTGNENSYAVNGVSKRQKDYDDFIAGLLGSDSDHTKLMTDINFFPSLPEVDTGTGKAKKKGRRTYLLEISGDVTVEDILNSDPEKWEPVKEDLLTMDYKDALSKAKSDKNGLEKRQKEIPLRIDEVSRMKTDVPNVAALAEQQNDLTAKIADLNAEVSAIEVDTTSISREKAELEMQLKEMQSNANLKLKQEKNLAIENYSHNRSEVASHEFELTKMKGNLEKLKVRFQARKDELSTYGERYKATQNPVPFDEKSNYCQYCGQMLPQGKLAEVKARYEEAEANRKRQNADALLKGKELRAEIDSLDAQIKELWEQIKSGEERASEANNILSRLKASINAMPEIADLSKNDEYVSLKLRITNLEEKISEITRSAMKANSVKAEIAQKERELADINKRFEEVETIKKTNAGIQERIEELEAEQRDIGQAIAFAERKIILLEEFSIAQSKMLSEKVNSHFRLAKFQLIDEYQSGGVNSACKIIYDGVAEENINTGHRIAVLTDIVNTFQYSYGVRFPLFIDNAEAMSSDNQPEFDGQLILLKVTDSPELKVSV